MKPCLCCQGIGNLGGKDKAFSLQRLTILETTFYMSTGVIPMLSTPGWSRDRFLDPREHSDPLPTSQWSPYWHLTLLLRQKYDNVWGFKKHMETQLVFLKG